MPGFRRASFFQNSLVRRCLQHLDDLLFYCARRGLETLKNELKTNQENSSKNQTKVGGTRPAEGGTRPGRAWTRPGRVPARPGRVQPGRLLFFHLVASSILHFFDSFL